MVRTATRQTRFLVLGLLIAGAVAAASVWSERTGPAIAGAARVIDGDSLFVRGVEIRLYGIDAVELYQTCTRAERTWRCGADAAAALRAATAGRDITCRSRDRDRYGRTVAICHAGGLDLGAAMVKGGFAIAYGAYEADEREARDARRGIWSSSFDRPSAWRARHPRRGS
jgi:endonuclease YncB( thermonuclease family)